MDNNGNGLKSYGQSGLLSDKAANEIVRLIIDNGWGEGYKIPNEHELAKKLNISRNTLREAIRALASHNIVDIRRGDGTYISKNCGVSKDPLGLRFVRNKSKLISDLMELRFMIEPELASMAALNREEKYLDELSGLEQMIEKAIAERKPFEENDIEFHKHIGKMSGNILAENILLAIVQPLAYLFNEDQNVYERDLVETHREIVSAIRRKNPDEAHEAMYLHLLYTKKVIRKNAILDI